MFTPKSPAKAQALAQLNELTARKIELNDTRQRLENAIDENVGRVPRHEKYRPSVLASSLGGWKPYG